MSALIVVDMQKDFCEGGSLAVPKASEIIPGINKEIQSGKYDLIVYTADWHPQDHVSFAANHPGEEVFSTIKVPQTGKEQVLWPVHCVAGTEGAKFHPDLLIHKDGVIIKKGTETLKECYSGFGYMEDGTDSGLAKVLVDKGIKEIFVTGVASDFCVGQTALSGLNHGLKVTVFEDLIHGIDPKNIKEWEKKFQEAGGKIAYSQSS